MGHSAAKCPLSFRCNQMVFFISKCLAECVLKENNLIQKKGDKRKVGIVIVRNFSCRLSQMSKLTVKT